MSLFSILIFATPITDLPPLHIWAPLSAQCSVIPDRGSWLADHRVADADALAFRELYALDNTVQVWIHLLLIATLMRLRVQLTS